jgi:hypothetical protein
MEQNSGEFPYPIPPRRSITNERRTEPITHQRAKEAAMRFIHSHFGQTDHARITIPLNLDDDDVVLMDYIEQQLLADLQRDRIKGKYIPWDQLTKEQQAIKPYAF